MSALRDRAKEHFPMVLLTLLSIVQALALELLWSHVREANYLLELSWTTAIAWLQIASTFMGLVLIWVVYASNAMRFRWVPVTSDSVYPFFIGVLEFMLVETLGPGKTAITMLSSRTSRRQHLEISSLRSRPCVRWRWRESIFG